MFLTTSFCKADQLSYITKEQAQAAVDFLKHKTEVVLWCACCDNDTKICVKVSKVYFEKVAYKDFYHVMLEGTDSHGKNIKQAIDLAYIHFLKDNKAYCVGKELNFKCDPCTVPFNFKK